MQVNEKELKILIEAFRGNPAQLTEHKEEQKRGCMNEPKTYFIDQFLDHLAEVRTGDTVILPKFTVPAVTMPGYDRAGDPDDNDMNFKEICVHDTARVVGNDGKTIELAFDHVLFQSAIDFNAVDKFEETQLGCYLNEKFSEAMRAAGIPAKTVDLLSYEEMFGDNAASFFKNGRNRVAFDMDEEQTHWYWLKSLKESNSSSALFCHANSYGGGDYNAASNADDYVRPRFVIEAR